MKPLLAITMGDPVGIGPEVVVRAAMKADLRDCADLVVFGDRVALLKAMSAIGVNVPIAEVERPRDARGAAGIALVAVSRLAEDTFAWATPTKASDRAQLEYIERGARAVLAREADAIVTAPIHKAAIARAGSRWPGHTEMLAAISAPPEEHTPKPVMMLAGDKLRTVPLTTHLALSAVPSRIELPSLLYAIRVVDAGLKKYFGLAKPRVAVAGLNPHAGEDGRFGDEEQRVISPAIAAAREEGIDASGPHAADAVFRRAYHGDFDVVIGMYHDQALIPIKLVEFDRAVNVTLGIPLIRTSVDHGTAYDIAGRGKASAASMVAAIQLAARMAKCARD